MAEEKTKSIFRLAPKPTFMLEDISLSVPGEAPGKLTLEVNYLNAEELTAWHEKYGGKPEIEGLSELIVRWPDGQVQDTNGADVHYSRDALAQLLKNYHVAGRQILTEYMREVLGARLKNS